MRGLELRLLGATRVFVDGRASTLRTRKALALLVFLAAEGGMHRREKLAELLWPASGAGRTALRSALASVRRTLGEGDTDSRGGFLKVEGDLLGVEAGPDLGLDLAVLREASQAARASRLGGQKGENLIATLKDADAAYRGEFLEGFGLEDAPEFDLWVISQRSLWRARVGEVLAHLGELEAERGELAASVSTAERWVARDPMEEAARVRLMEARSALGDPGGALEAYDEYRRDLLELGVDPGPEVEALAARVRTLAETVRSEKQPSAPGSLPMPFVGRGADFETLVEEYRAARSGEVRPVVVVGEAGIGKTRLVEEFVGWAASKGADTLVGRTSKTEMPLPYEALVDALRPRLERERAPDDLLEDRWLAELSRVLPELRSRYPDLPAPTADEASARALLFEALARLGAALAVKSPRRSGAGAGEKGEPLVVFLDDVQWADGATLDALRYACRSWARDGVPVLLLATVREEDLGEGAFGGWSSSLGRELPVRRITLAPIDENDIHNLLRLIAGATQPGANGTRQEDVQRVGRWLWDETDGHPLFLAQIVGVLLDRGVLAERAGYDGRTEVVLFGEGFDEAELRGLIPAGLRELVRDKLRPLPATAADVLAAGAVLGRGFGFGALTRVAGVGEAEGLSALDDLVSARLLEEGVMPSGSSGGTYSFAHDKIRDVAYTEAGEARRGVFHRRALEYLEDRGAPAAELARHAFAAGTREEAFRLLIAAAEEATAVFAAGDAVVYYERAREIRENPTWVTARVNGTVPEYLRLYGGLARACALIHDGARAQEAYERMLAVAHEAGDREAEWEALHGLGAQALGYTHGPEDAELLRGVRRREASEGLAASVDGAEEGPGRARSAAVYSHGSARRYAERALSLARELRREDLILRSEFGLGVACVWAGLWGEAVAHMEEVVSLHAAWADTEGSTLINPTWSKGLVAWGKGLVDGPDDAFGPTGALQKLRRETGALLGAVDTDYARTQMGATAMWLTMPGDYEEAIGQASRGLEAARSLGHPQLMFTNLVNLGNAHQEAFALAAARSEFSEMFDWVYFPVLRREIHARLCAVAALSGEWERAHEHALEALGLASEIFLPISHLHHHHDVEALLRGGDADLARENLRLFEQRTRGQRGYFRLAYLRSEAVLARWNGDTDGALSLLREALGLAEGLGLPGETWQVGATLGEVHEERGEGGPSERAFGRASVVIRRLAANMKDGDLRNGYLTAPQTRRVLEKVRDQGAHPGPPVS